MTSAARVAMLDVEQTEALVAYLRSHGRIGADERPLCAPLSGGVSSRVVLVRRGSGEAWVLKQSLERLRVPVEWHSDPRRIHREALGLRWLARLAPPGSVPEFLWEDHEHHLLAMRAVPQPHETWKSLLLAGRLESGHVRDFGRLLGTIHREAHVRRDALAEDFADRSFFESLRVEPYYLYTAAAVPEAAGFLYALVDDMRSRRLTLVHGDFSPKNILVTGGGLVLVDHEVVHFGDPAMDVGFALTHLLSKANHLAHLRDELASAAAACWRAYRDELAGVPWAADLEPRAVRQSLACLLARVAGRSRLEYLDAAAAGRQQRAACALMSAPPSRVEDLARAFVGKL